MIHRMSGPTQAPFIFYINLLYNIQFYMNCIINHVIEIFENRFKIEILKIRSLKLKIENFEIKFEI